MRDSSGLVAVTDHSVPASHYVRWEEHLPGLLTQFGVTAEGVVQVGAHIGQEVASLARCGFRRMVLMEPNHDHVTALREQLELHHQAARLPRPPGGLPAHEIVPAAAGSRRGRATLYVTDYDQQASLLAPKPPMVVTRQDSIPMIPVSEIQQGCNVLIADVQGAELEVLAGTDLGRLDLAVIEGSTWARYEGGSTLESIAAFMQGHGWRQVAVFPHSRPYVADVAWLAPEADRRLAEAG
jgi:FkbM family methyltransferase